MVELIDALKVVEESAWSLSGSLQETKCSGNGRMFLKTTADNRMVLVALSKAKRSKRSSQVAWTNLLKCTRRS